MSLLGNIWVKLGLKSDDFNTGVDRAEKRAERFGSFLGKVSAKVVLGWAAISTAIVKLTRTGIKNYQEAEAANIKLQNALKNTGAAIGVNYEGLRDYASQLQKVNGYADDATMSAMATLTTFRSVQGKVFKDTIAAAQDMASFLGTDLNAAVQQLGKALEAPEAGLSALRRTGVVFTDEMTEGIKKLVKEGKTYEAQMIILEEVNKRFGGSAAKQADTAASQWKRVGMAFGDLTEHIGAAHNATKALATSLATALETADQIISSEALTKWEKFKVIILGIGQSDAADKMVASDKAQKESAAHAAEYAKKQLDGLDSIEKAQARLKIEQKNLAEAEQGSNRQREADHRASVAAIEAHIQALNEKKAKEEEDAKLAAEKAKEEAERIKKWREEHTGLLNELKDEIAEKQKLLNMATDRTEIMRLQEEIKLLQTKQEYLKSGRDLTKISAVKGVRGEAQGATIGVDTSTLKHTQDEVDAFLEHFQAQQQKAENIANAFGSAIERGVIGALDELAEAIGTGDFDTTAFVKALVNPLADAAISTGLMVMSTGEALKALKAAMLDLFGGGPAGAIIAGAALMGIGVAAKAGIAAIASGSKGTTDSGTQSYSYTGGYGVSLPQGTGQTELSATVTVKGQDLQIALDNYNRNKGR